MNIKNYPDYLFNPETRHMVSIAHQDDEIMYCGLIMRMGADTRFIWMTNGDGLAPFENADPIEYAEIRKAETDEVLKTLKRPLSHRRCLDYSEIEIYDNFVDLTLDPSRKAEIMDFFYEIGCEIYREIRDYNPHVVWSSAFQNGHPEHDLVHILTGYALKQLERETGQFKAYYHLPEYEYTILIPMRFHPMYKGMVHRIHLNEKEQEIKRTALECYPSQISLFEKFEKVIDGLGMIGRLVGKPFSSKEFAATEYFAPVPDDIDYTKSTHWFEWANYMRDYNKDVKVSFDKHIAVIAEDMSKRTFK